MRAIFDWLEDRTGAVSGVKSFLYEDIPNSAGWQNVFGSMALFCFLLQAVSGFLLALNYAATPAEAHSSIRYIMNEVTGGALVRSLHHWGSSAMIIVVVVHMLQVFLWGAYKKPREATWLVGLGLLVVTLLFGLTGYLLPWDNRAYWGTVVTAEITGNSPVLGAYLLRLMGAENGVGAVTFSRFYALHTFLLPFAIVGMIGLHLYLFRRHGAAPAPGDDGASKKKFFPGQVLKDTVAIFALFCALVFLSITMTAPLGPLADPTDTSFIPRPEWYFLFLFESLKFFEGPAEIVGSHVLPGLAMAALAILPFLDRARIGSLRQRVPALCVAVIALGTWAGLTRSAILDTPERQRPFAERGGPQDWMELNASQLAGLAAVRQQGCQGCHPIAGRNGAGAPDLAYIGFRRDEQSIVEFLQTPRASAHGQAPINLPEPVIRDVAALVVRMDPLSAPGILNAGQEVAQGAAVYQRQGCAACHQVRDVGGTLGPSLDGVGVRHDYDWLFQHFEDPQSLVPDSIMPPVSIPGEDLDKLTKYMLEL